jgi:VWFA-related protein
MRPRSIAGAALIVLLASTQHVGLAGQSGGSRSDRQTISSSVNAVLVDVVVRDRKNQPVTDLSVADFDVFEDGARQTIDTFTRVSRGSGIGVGIAWRAPDTPVAVNPTDPAAPPPVEEPIEETTTAVVFDHLSAEALRHAQRATLQYIPATTDSPARVAVFATGGGVRLVQRYTQDLTRVRQAIQNVVPAGTSAAEAKADRVDQLIARRSEIRTRVESAAAGVVSGGSAVVAANSAELGTLDTELRMIQTELNMARSFDNLDRDHKGYDTALALLAVVQTLSVYPGRKTIVFFSEGLPVSPSLSARLDYVIDIANRANVTAYVIDAKGLRTKSSATTMRDEMKTFVDERMAQIGSGSDRTEQPLTMAFERVEDTLKLDSRTGLARLAEDTGGFLIEQSNDLSSAFRRIEEDTRFHYMLSYSPSNAEFDGKFREIRVRVRRPGVQVFARKGYRALPGPGAIGAAYDAPALALLSNTPLPNAFPMNAAGFAFPDPARPGLTPIVVKVGTDALRFTVDERRGTYSAQAVVVVRVRDVHGDEVQKLSQQYLLAGDAKDVDAATKGDILFYREADLTPGVYTMESIVYDPIARQGSVRIATLTVPAPERSIVSMSSLLIVTRAEEVADVSPEAIASAPLYVGHTLLYPNVGEPIRRAPSGELSFYFVLYGPVKGLRATAELLQNGRALAEAPVTLPPALGSRVQHVGRLPIGELPAGTYQLRIRVTDGAREESRTAYFTLRN